jgi:hypothetical protein
MASSVDFAVMLLSGCFNHSSPSQSQNQDIQKETAMNKSESESLKYVTYCGLYCGLCSQRSRIPKQAKALRDSMAKDGFDQWGQDMPNFKEFWAFLNQWCDLNNCCPGCRQGGGNPECEIRKCAQQRKVEFCPSCEDYPCKSMSTLGKIYPILIADGQRLKEIGAERWIPEQHKRTETGFVYSDIRNNP